MQEAIFRMKEFSMSAGASSTSLSVNVEFLQDVHTGLSRPQKTLPCKYFYDARGSKLFDRICELDEYYPTRTELSIMQTQIEGIASAVGNNCTLIEFGSGSSLKTRLLLDHLEAPLSYVPIDISGDHLADIADELQSRYPDFDIFPVEADFTQPLENHQLAELPSRRVIYFPGSTIGNFNRHEAVQLLKQMRDLAGPDGSFIIGIDLKKDRTILTAAYNDDDGVTAQFNLNLLSRINEELDGDFDLAQFRHEAIWNEELARIEMHLVSECEQTVSLEGESYTIQTGETIHTESSHKYTIDSFRKMTDESGLKIDNVWTDSDKWFAVICCVLGD